MHAPINIASQQTLRRFIGRVYVFDLDLFVRVFVQACATAYISTHLHTYVHTYHVPLHNVHTHDMCVCVCVCVCASTCHW